MVRSLIGLLGVLLAVIAAEFNDQLLATSLADVTGSFGLDHDVASWLATAYVVGEVLGMSTAPALSVIFSIRRFALFVIGFALLPTLLIPLAPNGTTLLVLRTWQGLAGGLTIPLLMSIALRVLAPPIRLYGLAVYACSATVAPNLAVSYAIFWTDAIGMTKSLFVGSLPIATLAAMLVWYGVPQDPPKLDNLRRFDWIGALLVLVGFGSFAVMLEQGDRLDWFHSTPICLLALTATIGIPALIWREMTAPLPLFKLALLGRRNFAYGVIALIFVLVVASGATSVPIQFLAQVQAYRLAQAHYLTLVVALSQLVLLPLTALLLNHEHVDARLVTALGCGLLIVALVGNTGMTAEWSRQNFYGWQLLQSVGLAFVVLPLLMIATNEVKMDEGPFASGLVNTPRALAAAIGTWVTELVARERGADYTSGILSTLGSRRYTAVQGVAVGHNIPALLPDGSPSEPGALAQLSATVQEQVAILVQIDTLWVLAGLLVVLLLILAILPVRSYPPQIHLTKQS